MSIPDLKIDPVPAVSNYSVKLTLPVTGEKIDLLAPYWIERLIEVTASERE